VELGAELSAWGFDGAAVVRTIEQYQHAIARDAPLDPPRTRNRPTFVEPPFHAMEVQPAITFAHGGLQIDTEARVIGIDGLPIAGLYAAGADAAGVFDRGYGGGLSNALVFGLRAARGVLERAADASA
jgi:succinate dehydrogenase/fumarate reductase flavoprotein subunit